MSQLAVALAVLVAVTFVSLKASATVGPVACRGCSVKVIPCSAVPADASVLDALCG